MKRAVVWVSGARILARTLVGRSGPERERETGRSESVPAPVELRLQ